MEDLNIAETLRQGIAAVRCGQNERGRELLMRVIEHDERNEAAWLWLSGAVQDPQERQICLENVLAINPGNAAAQAGLRRLANPAGPSAGQPPEQMPVRPAPPAEYVPAQPSPPSPPPDAPSPTRPSAGTLPARPPIGPAVVEFDPFGCPYCGGTVAPDEQRCTSCGRPAELRFRKRSDGPWLGWLVLFIALQGVVAAGDALFVAWLVVVRQLPTLLSQTVVALLIGRSFLAQGGLSSNLDRLVLGVIVMNLAMGLACVVLAVGLALRSRLAYFVTTLVLGWLALLAIGAAAIGLDGILPAAFRLLLVAVGIKWLMDSGQEFEWETHRYNADIDPDLETAMDYYSQGARYADMGMWAKAAAHWKVATQLEGARPELFVELARAYLKLGYPAAARVQAEKAVARAPDNPAIRAFRDSLS